MVPLDTTATQGPHEHRAFVAANPAAQPDDFGGAAYQAAKDAVKHQRNGEQGGLCIYCEQALGPTDGHVEHLVPKGGDQAQPSLAFEYSNLVQSCEGWSDKTGTKRHCGHRKGETPLAFLPEPGCNARLRLQGSGVIAPDGSLSASEKAAIAADLVTLGLNAPAELKSARAKEVEELQKVVTTPGASVPAYLSSRPFRHILQRL